MSTSHLLALAALALWIPIRTPSPALMPLSALLQPDGDGDDDHGHGHGDDACSSTAELAYRARLNDVEDDYLLALAKCANISDRRERSQCERDARDARREGRDEAQSQREARLELCDLLGGGAYDPIIDPRDFVRDVTNPYYPLVPGTVLTYRSVTSEGVEMDRVEVTHERKEIQGVSCIVVHDVARLDGDVIEDTRDFFAQDRFGNVWYFGEATQQVEDGEVIGIDGSFQAGRDSAKAGIVMLATPAVNRTYRQEFSLAEAEDAATVLDLHAHASVPYGSFSNCIRTRDFSPLEPDVLENKYYAAGIGSVLEVDLTTGETLELVSVTTAP